MGYYYNATERAFYPIPSRSEGSESGTDAEGNPVTWQITYIIACGNNAPENPATVLCGGAFCTAPGGEPGISVLVYRRLSSQDPWEPWPNATGLGQRQECMASTEPITLDEIRDEIVAIIEERFRNIAEPQIRIDPATSPIVNLPVLASTEDPGPVGFDIVNPLPGSVQASPTYRWSWSNGVTATGPGRAYDGTSPSSRPDYYGVLSVYSRSGAGSVALEVTWAVTLTVAGVAPVTDIEPLVYTAEADFTVRSARTVLVD